MTAASNTIAEAEAVQGVIAAVTQEALTMALSTRPGQRMGELVALHATIPDRLIERGVSPSRAAVLAKGIRISVEVPSDGN